MDNTSYQDRFVSDIYCVIRRFSILLIGGLLAACDQNGQLAKPSPSAPSIQRFTETIDDFEQTEPIPGACIPSGNQDSIQNTLTGEGAKAVLCQNSVFELFDTINFTDDDQEIYTQGLPTDDSRAFLKVLGEDVDTAVSVENTSGVTLRNVIIDGNRPTLGSATGALIEWGGTGTGNLVEWVKAYEPRGWSIIAVNEGDDHKCSGAIVRDNELGPAGRHEFGMADGISLACRNSIVENNTIVDATDGGIVIFQAPGSLVANNVIRTENRVMFYGISMEDFGPFDGDFTGTRVIGNTIEADGALIRRGIGMGPHVGCIPLEEATLRNRGAVVTDNTLLGDRMGYGFVVGGVEDWTLTGNVDLSTHLVPEWDAYCFEDVVDDPAGFQFVASTSSGNFQDEFVGSVLGFTAEWWSTEAVFSEECLRELIGPETLEEIKAGGRGPLLPALESSENGERLDQCVSIYPPAEVLDPNADIELRGILPCEPFCIEVELANPSETQTVNMEGAEFWLESFLVQCHDLPAFLGAGESTRCTIDDYVTAGFQVLKLYGFSGGPIGWGFEYPLEDGS